MSNLSNIDKMKFEKLFGMTSGYVLEFSNRTFAEFIMDSVNLDIYDSKYDYGSGSKANRLRAFWTRESDDFVGKLLLDLLESWKTQKLLNSQDIKTNEQKLYEECSKIANRLLGKTQTETTTEGEFLNKEFAEISLNSLKLDSTITGILELRLNEVKKCLKAKASLAVIFLSGSTLEGILLGVATNHPQAFNQSSSSPKDKQGRVSPFHNWTLSNFIDVACDVGLIDLDIKKFSHALRDFRNYIHPFQQMVSKFNPDEHTAKICWQVLKAAIADLSKKIK